MGQVSACLRRVATKDGSIGYGHYCPGCGQIHIVYVKSDGARQGRPIWGFNDNLEKPSFTPSVRYFEPEHLDDGVKVPEHTICHYHITDGEIRYCGDCQHELSGKTVPLPALPARYSDDQYGWPGE